MLTTAPPRTQLLHIAAREGQHDVVRLLLDSGADVNALDYVRVASLQCCPAGLDGLTCACPDGPAKHTPCHLSAICGQPRDSLVD